MQHIQHADIGGFGQRNGNVTGPYAHPHQLTHRRSNVRRLQLPAVEIQRRQVVSRVVRRHPRLNHGAALKRHPLRAQIGTPHHLADGAAGDHAAVSHQHHRFSKLHHLFNGVRYVNDGHADFFVQSGDIPQHLALARLIKRSQRLVHQ